jgi:hypothetical protein
MVAMERQVDPGLHALMQALVNNQRTLWDDFYASGGWGMYPTTLFGFVLVLAGCRYLFRPQSSLLRIIATSAVLTASSGVLAMCTGLLIVFTYVQSVPPADAAKVAVVGAAQAMVNIVFALILVNLGAIPTLIRLIRDARRAAG